jgi:glycosyltransferase involved in cell wall biosynthesis
VADADFFLLRGRRVAQRIAQTPTMHGRLLTYLTDIPQNVVELSPTEARQIGDVVAASAAFLCQTEEMRSFVDQCIPGASGKAFVLPPMIPEEQLPVPELRDDGGIRLAYSGKFAPDWNTLEMTKLPALFADRGSRATLVAIGDKIHNDPGDPQWQNAMRMALTSTAGVDWRGGLSRDLAMAESAKCQFGLTWRHPNLDDSLELSTKLLEYCAIGLPPVLNRTPMHENLLGEDYPLFASSANDVVTGVRAVASNPDLYTAIQRAVRRVADSFTLEEGTKRLAALLARLRPLPVLQESRAARVVFLSWDWKFIDRIVDRLEAEPSLDVVRDEWRSIREHDARRTERLVRSANTVVAEWCGPNAILASQLVSPRQRLIIRLHRFELYSGYWRQVRIEAVEAVVAVNDYYRDLIVETTGWPNDKVITIPNWVDTTMLDRPKPAGAEWNLGLIGIAPARKRLDWALDVLDHLRREDLRYTLHIKSKLPWQYPWIWGDPDERRHYRRIFARLAEPRLTGSLSFDPFGPDVGAWLQKIGHVLSTSDDESFHLAPAEGMASGALPSVRRWPGAETTYHERWISDTPDEMASKIMRLNESPEDRAEAVATARSFVSEHFDLSVVAARWIDLVAKQG